MSLLIDDPFLDNTSSVVGLHAVTMTLVKSEMDQETQHTTVINDSECSHVEKILKPFMCHICSAAFRRKDAVRRHMKTHSSDRPFQCQHCPATFKYKQKLDNHLLVHGKVTPHQCHICGKSFRSDIQLISHERTHEGDRPYKCQVANCYYASTSRNGLYCHTRARHSKELGLEQFSCPTCGSTFGLKSHLNRHMQGH